MSDLQQRFITKLEHQWRRKATGGRSYVDVRQLRLWMNDTETNEAFSNCARLLQEVYSRSRFGNPLIKPTAISISTGDDCAVLVFSILLELGHGDLIHLFQSSKIVDKDLAASEHHNRRLRDELDQNNVTGAAEIAQKFEARKWSFCPAFIKYGKHEKFDGGKWILPFAKRDRINEKGGTAEVWQILVQEDVISQDLKDAIAASRFKDKDFGWCYQLALKTYSAGSVNLYQGELLAFKLLRKQKGMVQYLADFLFDGSDKPDGTSERTYNILLEYGELDLDEFFADTSPPVRAPEIIHFWKSMFEVAEALGRLHNAKDQDEDGLVRESNGWHADLKPDNILRVHGELKLADFGFAKFQQKGTEIPKAFIEGGTGTFGAPETDGHRLRRGTRTPVTQNIDIWSFGCVLSLTVTWVVLGLQGIRQYEALRMQAIRSLRELRTKEEHMFTPTADDTFHDGKDVLPQVLDWHNYLRSVMRKSDTISGNVLDLVENRMLCQDPNRRIPSISLCENLNDILKLGEIRDSAAVNADYANQTAKTVLKALLDFDNRARSNSTDDENGKVDGDLRYKAQSIANSNILSKERSILRVAQDHQPRTSTRIGKSQRLDNIPLVQTAHRAKILERELEADSKIHPMTQNPQSLPTSRQASIDLTRICESPTEQDQEQLVQSKPPSDTGSPATPPRSRDTIPSLRLIGNSPVTLANNKNANSTTYYHDGNSPISQDLVSSSNASDPLSVAKGSESIQRPIRPQTDYSLQPSNMVGEVSLSSTQEGTNGPLEKDLSSHTNELGTDRSRPTPLLHAQPASNHAPVTPIQELFDIYKVKKELEENRRTGLRVRWLRPKRDLVLKNFVKNRDLIFIVDSGSSMHPFWDRATDVLTTLAEKVAGLDEDGLDLVFTIGTDYNINNASGQSTVTRFEKAMKNATPSLLPETKTNMVETLSHVFSSYLKSHEKKATTLLILTDGVWKGSVREHGVEKKIAEFIQRLKRQHLEAYRHFTIQFIRFGNDENARARLNRLDNDMEREFKIDDVIDTVHWTGKVQKMILGSLRENEDDDEDDVRDEVANSPISPRPVPSNVDIRTANHQLSDHSSSKSVYEPPDRAPASQTTASGKKKRSRFSIFG